MQVFFKKSFIKDFSKLPRNVQQQTREICLVVFPKIKNLDEFRPVTIKRIRTFKNYYRIRIGNYRIGFRKDKDQIIFSRVLHRKDIYKLFP